MAKFATLDEYLSALPAAQRELTDLLLPIVEAELPGAGGLWHGHPVWSLGGAPGKAPVCYLKAYSGYVTFGFWRGAEITEDAERLEAGARGMAAVKLRAPADVEAGLFAGWLRQARELEAPAGA